MKVFKFTSRLLLIILLLTIVIISCNSENNFRKCYVSYENKDFNGKEKFTIYVQNKINPIYYFGFEVSHEQDTSDLVYSNQYRLQKGLIYEFDGKSMQYVGLTVLSTGESECVYRTSNKVDFTGGIHGDEQLIEVNFYIDSVQLSSTELDQNFYLKPCEEFAYIQKSNMYESLENGKAINSNRIVEAVHIKRSVFKNSGYETYNRLNWKKKSVIETAYMSISSISVDVGEFCQTNSSEICILDRSSDFKCKGTGNSLRIWNDSNGLSALINSEFSLNNNSAIQFIWDRPNYTKYYRNLVFDDPELKEVGEIWQSNNPFKVNEGDIWESNTSILFLME